jgi:hypothetical protein
VGQIERKMGGGGRLSVPTWSSFCAGILGLAVAREFSVAVLEKGGVASRPIEAQLASRE